MACIRCKKEKDGLIYITNLVDETHSTLNRKVINTMLNLAKKKESSWFGFDIFNVQLLFSK